jgi:hypothetical protein
VILGHAIIGTHNGCARSVSVNGVDLTPLMNAHITVNVQAGFVVVSIPISTYEIRERRDDA